MILVSMLVSSLTIFFGAYLCSALLMSLYELRLLNLTTYDLTNFMIY